MISSPLIPLGHDGNDMAAHDLQRRDPVDTDHPAEHCLDAHAGQPAELAEQFFRL
jgi:hypothetical protein